MELHSGFRVTDSIELVRPLGEGGMGSVWVAHHHGLGVDVAVKFLGSTLVEDPSMLQRFTREARAAAQIKSPYVVQVFDHGVTAGRPYIVMELLEGEELGARIARLGPLRPSEVATIVTQVARALERAHAHGIVHRDIKPSNVFLTDPDGDVFVKLLDFGIAKRAEKDERGVTATGVVMGTAYYMSPEQVHDPRSVDARTDLWSTAVMAYEAVSGKLPFNGTSVGAVLVAVDRGVFELPYAAYGLGSKELDEWFRRALSRDPALRFATAQALASEFAAAIQRTSKQFGGVIGSGTPSVRPYDATAPAASVPISLPLSLPWWNRRSLGLGLSALVLGLSGVAVWFSSLASDDPIADEATAGVASLSTETSEAIADGVARDDVVADPVVADPVIVDAIVAPDAGASKSKGAEADPGGAEGASSARPASEKRTPAESAARRPASGPPANDSRWDRGQGRRESVSEGPKPPKSSTEGESTGAAGDTPPKDYGF